MHMHERLRSRLHHCHHARRRAPWRPWRPPTVPPRTPAKRGRLAAPRTGMNARSDHEASDRVRVGWAVEEGARSIAVLRRNLRLTQIKGLSLFTRVTNSQPYTIPPHSIRLMRTRHVPQRQCPLMTLQDSRARPNWIVGFSGPRIRESNWIITPANPCQRPLAPLGGS